MEEQLGTQGWAARPNRARGDFGRSRFARFGMAALAVAGAGALAAASAAPAGAGVTDRTSDPVVMTGADLDDLTGLAPERIVGYRSTGGGWQQIPVQVDERAQVNLRSLYPGPSSNYQYVYSDEPFVVDTYTDPDTLVGPDPEPAFDAGDELALMAADTGKKAGAKAGLPKGVKGSATEVEVTDPIDGAKSYVYLFEGGQGTDPSAGKKYVDYRFRLIENGSLLDESKYKDAYDFANGPNPESSVVATPFYSTRSVDRWTDTELRLKGDGATNVDILDRDKAMFYPGFCGRTEDTFSGLDDQGPMDEEGSFIINKSGPVRALRSYIGANSGPYVNRLHIYYARRQDISTILRVHAIPNVMQFIDYSPAASGMTYRNELNAAGVTIDGVPDDVAEGVPDDVVSGAAAWEQVSGPQGTVSIVTSMQHDFPSMSVTNYYLDQSSPSGGAENQCTGDEFAYGSSGFWINSPLPNTDPVLGPANNLTSNRSFYYDGPAAGGPGTAERRKQEATNPLTVQSRPLVAAPAKLKLTLRKPGGKFGASEKAKLKLEVKNTGGAATPKLKICVQGPKKSLKGLGCERGGALEPGESSKTVRKLTVKRKAKSGKLKLRIAVKGKGMKTAKGKARVKIA